MGCAWSGHTRPRKMQSHRPRDVAGQGNPEMSLLRARFDLRLDAERLRTQSMTEELQSACNQAVRAEQFAAHRQIEAMRSEFAEDVARHRAGEAATIRALKAQVEELRVSRDETLASESRQATEGKTPNFGVFPLSKASATEEQLSSELRAASRAARSAEADAASARREASATALSAREGLAREVEADVRAELLDEVKAAFEQRREQQVTEVLAKLEGEHFRLSVEAAQEAKRRLVAEEEATELRTKLDSLRSLLASQAEEAEEEKAGRHPPETVEIGILTETEGDSVPSPGREALRFRLAEAEGRLMGHMDTSASQLEFLEARLRRALASKNDVIDELKDELGRREAEIFEARSILAGLATEEPTKRVPAKRLRPRTQKLPSLLGWHAGPLVLAISDEAGAALCGGVEESKEWLFPWLVLQEGF
eukprot:s585_g11.t1